MKYVLILCDGMADLPVEELGYKTPLSYATTPNMDAIAPLSTIGLASTVPDGFEPASDVANLGVLGYDVRDCYTGRSPLEALSMGVDLKRGEIALRANIISLSDDEPFEQKRLINYDAGDISDADADEIICTLNERLASSKARFYKGTAYRHCLIVKDALPNDTLTPPHNITGKQIGEYLAKGPLADFLNNLTKQSYDLLSNHPLNQKRAKEGKRSANAVWFWGEGTAPKLESFENKYKKRGAMISAVDLLKGIAVASDMDVVEIKGATGTLDTDYLAKANGAIDALENGCDFCMIHIESTDECGHQKDVRGKVQAIQNIDKKIVGTLLSHFAQNDEPFRMLIMPDHPTPVTIGKHTSEPVPFLLFDSQKANVYHASCIPATQNDSVCFDEQTASQSGVYHANPWDTIDLLFK